MEYYVHAGISAVLMWLAKDIPAFPRNSQENYGIRLFRRCEGNKVSVTYENGEEVVSLDVSKLSEAVSLITAKYDSEHPDAKRLCFTYLARLGTVIGADWEIEVKKELAKLPVVAPVYSPPADITDISNWKKAIG